MMQNHTLDEIIPIITTPEFNEFVKKNGGNEVFSSDEVTNTLKNLNFNCYKRGELVIINIIDLIKIHCLCE